MDHVTHLSSPCSAPGNSMLVLPISSYISNGDRNPSPNALEISAIVPLLVVIPKPDVILPLFPALIDRAPMIIDFHFLLFAIDTVSCIRSSPTISLAHLSEITAACPSGRSCLLYFPLVDVRLSVCPRVRRLASLPHAFRSRKVFLYLRRYDSLVSSVRFRPFC